MRTKDGNMMETLRTVRLMSSVRLIELLSFPFVSYLTQLSLKEGNYTQFGRNTKNYRKLPSFELKPEKYEK